MTFPVNVPFQVADLFGGQPQTLAVYSGLTTFVGENGSGKSQVLRALKTNETLKQIANTFVGPAGRPRQVRYLPVGRLAFLENFRQTGQGSSVPNYDYANYGSRTFRWTDTPYPADSAEVDFHALWERIDLQIKVSERLRKLFKREVHFEGVDGNLRVQFSRAENATQRYSSSREASGLLHLVAILSALYNDEYGVLLIDEPEISLHPQLQVFLKREIQSVAGYPDGTAAKKIVIIATHSTSMLDVRRASDLSNIVFFTKANTPPVQIAQGHGALTSQRIEALIARMGQSHRDAFFASKPLLVEGPSDEIICSFLDNHLNLYANAAGAQIVPVIGNGEMPVVANLMHLIGKNPVILTDLDTIAENTSIVGLFNNDQRGRELAQRHMHQDVVSLARGVYQSFADLVTNYWGEIASLAEQHSYWINRDPNATDDTSAKRRAALAVLLTSPESTLPTQHDWRGIRIRFQALLDFLEQVGCFILPRGTIENYYLCSNLTATEKPSKAAEETVYLATASRQDIEDRYDVVIRALRFASDAPVIDEAAEVQSVLGAVVGAVMPAIRAESTDDTLTATALRTVADRAKIFRLWNATDEQGDVQLGVDLSSQILDVSGFPFQLPERENPTPIIRRNVRPRSS
ncbi:MAG: AAA family ATPase [Acidobacteriota bacterium]|nr:AAA family ATPase [Acidobacteriota bacterium]